MQIHAPGPLGENIPLCAAVHMMVTALPGLCYEGEAKAQLGGKGQERERARTGSASTRCRRNGPWVKE